MKDIIVALICSMIANVILVAVNNYLLFAILGRFKEWWNNEKSKQQKDS